MIIHIINTSVLKNRGSARAQNPSRAHRMSASAAHARPCKVRARTDFPNEVRSSACDRASRALAHGNARRERSAQMLYQLTAHTWLLDIMRERQKIVLRCDERSREKGSGRRDSSGIDSSPDIKPSGQAYAA